MAHWGCGFLQRVQGLFRNFFERVGHRLTSCVFGSNQWEMSVPATSAIGCASSPELRSGVQVAGCGV